MKLAPEVKAINSIMSTLTSLPPDSRSRVVQYIAHWSSTFGFGEPVAERLPTIDDAPTQGLPA